MSKRICAKLENECVRIFDEQSRWFGDIESLFWYPDVSNQKEFDANVKLEQDERFFVVLSEKQKNSMLSQYFRLLDNSASTNQIHANQYREIRAIFLISKEDWQQNHSILFSKITPTGRIEHKQFILWNAWNPQLKTISHWIDITWKIDSYWNGEKLFFKKYETVRWLFPWIEDFYQTATPEEVESFKNNWFFNFTMKNSSIWTRNLRRIAYIVREKNIDFSSSETRIKFKRYAETYGITLPFDENNKIKIANNKVLWNAISIIEENYYTSEITREKKVAEYSKVVNLVNNS